MIIFDFEVFMYDWLVVFKDIITEEYITIKNDKEKLKKYYEENKNKLFIGFNNSRYDNYILKGILLDKDPYYISNMIINGKENYIWRVASWNDIPLISYDVSFGLGFTSLKENEAYLGISIDECPVSFDKASNLTDSEVELVEEYCKRDIDATSLLFEKTRNTFETKLYLISTFDLDKSYLNKSDQSIIEKILGADKPYKCRDEFEPFDFKQLNLKISKYKKVIEHFSQPISENYKSISLDIDIAGVPHQLGIGGIHGAINNYNYSGKIMNLDVASYYPSMMIEYDWFGRSIPDDKKKLYAKMKKDRIQLKKTNKKLADAYKLVLNTTYGCYKYKWVNLYDPRQANNITIGGQVMMVDLIENLEPYMSLIQSNTDGIIIIPHDEEKIMEVVKDWEKRTRMELEVSYGKKIVQKDVNNYVMKYDDGYINAVGGYVNMYNPRGVRRTLSIVDKALVEHLMNDISIEEYIKKNNDLLDYQIISKVGKTYDKVFTEDSSGKQTETNFVNRGFASFKYNRLYKQKINKNKELVANQPENNLIWNKHLNELNISEIDKQWYIDMTYKRLNDYKGGIK